MLYFCWNSSNIGEKKIQNKGDLYPVNVGYLLLFLPCLNSVSLPPPAFPVITDININYLLVALTVINLLTHIIGISYGN